MSTNLHELIIVVADDGERTKKPVSPQLIVVADDGRHLAIELSAPVSDEKVIEADGMPVACVRVVVRPFVRGIRISGTDGTGSDSTARRKGYVRLDVQRLIEGDIPW